MITISQLTSRKSCFMCLCICFLQVQLTHLADSWHISDATSMPCEQTVMYSAITYPMLQLEWTAAKVFWYLAMQVRDRSASFSIAVH